MKSVSYLIEYAKAQVGRPYFYGTFGSKASESLYRQKKNQYPNYYTWNYDHKFDGLKVHDCAGLVKGAAWCPTPDSVPTYVASQDMGATGMYNEATVKGRLPKDDLVAGALVFKGNVETKKHVGVYVGGGKIIEAKGHVYGVVESTLDSSWGFWAYSSLFDYGDASETPSTPVETVPDNFEFDKSICERCPGIALKVCTQIDDLMLRHQPNGTILKRMPRGSTVTYKGYHKGKWLYVNYNGTWGFAYSDYLR